ncbi:DUF416 family protein [Pedobacter kyonggii]|uniref:DUF416 family protein n=1 Tax=Pedobacter kyonggii TaxID=1926871 RepID=A0A4Q9HDN0_9SPHI|nr:DUF416 family protein [Pedobacter kyonggii]TBO42712.1 DUF416 family protein [Pedobacter kyonggii]
MTQLEFIKLLEHKVTGSSPTVLIDFALDICERLQPEYTSFSENHNWGDANLLKECIEFCRVGKGTMVNHSDIKFYLDKLDPNIPDMDDFGDFDSSYALNTSCVVCELLEYLSDKDKSHIFNISTYMTHTIDFKLSEADANLTNEELENHSDLIREWEYQLKLVETA